MTTRQRARGFRDLEVWQEARQLVTDVYALSSAFPAHEQFALTSQLRRATTSVACNIAEGWGRGSRPELHRFATIARGSLQEVDTLLDIAQNLGYADEGQLREARAHLGATARMLTALRHSLRR